MVGHWPADDYQHEDSKVLRAASTIVQQQAGSADTIGVFSRLGRRISMLARVLIILLCLPKAGVARCLATSSISCHDY